jgi:hypothetical protein
MFDISLPLLSRATTLVRANDRRRRQTVRPPGNPAKYPLEIRVHPWKAKLGEISSAARLALGMRLYTITHFRISI